MSAENPIAPETYAGKMKEIRQEAERFEDLERELAALETQQEGAIKGWDKDIEFIRGQIDFFREDLFAPEEIDKKTAEEIDALYEKMVDTRTAMDNFMATYRAQARLLHLENEYQGESGVKLLDKNHVEQAFGAQLAAVAQDYEQNKGSLEGVDLKALEDLRKELGLSEEEFGPVLEEMLQTAHGSLARDLYNEEKTGVSFTSKLWQSIKNAPQRMSVSMAATLGVAKGIGLAAGALGVAGGTAGALVTGASIAAPALVLAGGKWAWQKWVGNPRKLQGYETAINEAVTWDESVRDDKQKALAGKYQGNLVDAIRFKKADQLEARQEKEGKTPSSWEDIRLKYVKGEIKDRDKLRAELTARKEQLEKEAFELAKKASPDLAAIEAAQKKAQELNDALQVFYFTESSLELEREVFVSRAKGAEEKAAPKVEELVKKGQRVQYATYAGYGLASRALYKLAENTAWLPWLQKGALAAGGAYAGYKMTSEALEKWRQIEGMTAKQKITRKALRLGGALAGGVAAGLGGSEVLDYTREHLNDYFTSQQSAKGPETAPAPASLFNAAQGEGQGLPPGQQDVAKYFHKVDEDKKNPADLFNIHQAEKDAAIPPVDVPPTPAKLAELGKLINDPKFQGASMAEKYVMLETEAKSGGLARWEDEIRTPEGSNKHDSVWASTRSLLKAHATELGITKTGADLDKWAETQTANLVKQLGLDEGGRVKDKVFNGAEVVVYKGSGDKLYLQYNEHPEAHPGQTAGFLHEHKIAATEPVAPAEHHEDVVPEGKGSAITGAEMAEPVKASTGTGIEDAVSAIPERTGTGLASGGGGSQGAETGVEAAAVAATEAKGKGAEAVKQMYDSWPTDKRMAFNHIYKVNNNAFQLHPEVKWPEYLKGFDDVTKQTTDLVKSGKLAGARFGGEPYPVQGADGKVHLIEQAKAGKDRWHLYEINAKGKMIQQKAPGENWLARIQPAKVFNGQEVQQALGFKPAVAHVEDAAPAQTLAQGVKAAEAGPDFQPAAVEPPPHSEATATAPGGAKIIEQSAEQHHINEPGRVGEIKETHQEAIDNKGVKTTINTQESKVALSGAEAYKANLEGQKLHQALAHNNIKNEKSFLETMEKIKGSPLTDLEKKGSGVFFRSLPKDRLSPASQFRTIAFMQEFFAHQPAAEVPAAAAEAVPLVESVPAAEAPPVGDPKIAEFLGESYKYSAGQKLSPEELDNMPDADRGEYFRFRARELAQTYLNQPSPDNLEKLRGLLLPEKPDQLDAAKWQAARQEIESAFSGQYKQTLESLEKLVKTK